MRKIAIFGAAVAAALAVAAPASAKSVKHAGYAYGQGAAKHAMPLRSNKDGALRGHARADYVHSLNRAKRYGY